MQGDKFLVLKGIPNFGGHAVSEGVILEEPKNERRRFTRLLQFGHIVPEVEGAALKAKLKRALSLCRKAEELNAQLDEQAEELNAQLDEQAEELRRLKAELKEAKSAPPKPDPPLGSRRPGETTDQPLNRKKNSELLAIARASFPAKLFSDSEKRQGLIDLIKGSKE